MENKETLANKTIEIKRLIKAFENQAKKFHKIEFHTYEYHQGQEVENIKFKQPNHLIMLWQFIGKLSGNNEINQFVSNVNDSNLKWGIRGAELTKYGVIIGKATDKFVGNNNEQDVLNTQLAVVNKVIAVLRRGTLMQDLYQLDGNASCEPFYERFENRLAGWASTFDVLIHNDITIC